MVLLVTCRKTRSFEELVMLLTASSVYHTALGHKSEQSPDGALPERLQTSDFSPVTTHIN